jgi:CRISPR-associated protein Cas2
MATVIAREGTTRLVVAYDITNDRRRERLAQLLADFGVRVQYSVFECALTESQETELLRLIPKRIDQAEDAVTVYPLCRRCEPSTVRFGRQDRPRAARQLFLW